MFNFILPNGSKIDIDGVIDAMGDFVSETRYFLNTLNGEVGCVELDDKKFLENITKNPNYIEIPKVTERSQRKCMRKFADIMLKDGDREEKKLYEKIRKALVKGELGKCITILEKSKMGWIHGWAQWQGDQIFEEMEGWFKTLPIPITEKFEADDDCELCKLMEKGEHNLADFKEAAQKEIRKGAIGWIKPDDEVVDL